MSTPSSADLQTHIEAVIVTEPSCVMVCTLALAESVCAAGIQPHGSWAPWFLDYAGRARETVEEAAETMYQTLVPQFAAVLWEPQERGDGMAARSAPYYLALARSTTGLADQIENAIVYKGLVPLAALDLAGAPMWVGIEMTPDGRPTVSVVRRTTQAAMDHDIEIMESCCIEDLPDVKRLEDLVAEARVWYDAQCQLVETLETSNPRLEWRIGYARTERYCAQDELRRAQADLDSVRVLLVKAEQQTKHPKAATPSRRSKVN